MTPSESEQRKQALLTSLRMLAAAPKSRKQLERKLLDKGYPDPVVKDTLNQLDEQGLLNDRMFAQSLIQIFSTNRISGRKRIAFELKKRGIPGPLTQELLGNRTAPEEQTKALELAKGKFERWQALEKMRRRKKVYDFLVRRGFDFDVAREAVKLAEHGTAQP